MRFNFGDMAEEDIKPDSDILKPLHEMYPKAGYYLDKKPLDIIMDAIINKRLKYYRRCWKYIYFPNNKLRRLGIPMRRKAGIRKIIKQYKRKGRK